MSIAATPFDCLLGRLNGSVGCSPVYRIGVHLVASQIDASHFVKRPLLGTRVVELCPVAGCRAGVPATEDEDGQSAEEQSAANTNSNADADAGACGQAGG